MVQWVYEASLAADVGDRVVVATPDPEIADAVRRFGGEAILTRHDHVTGTDRIAEVAEKLGPGSYINVQGDEPLIPIATIRACGDAMSSGVEMASIWCECADSEIEEPSVVKVVSDLEGYALYFSRFPIPFPRNERPIPVKKHIGIYGYRSDVLSAFSTWPESSLEKSEGLEQLRFMEHGVRILMAWGEGGIAVDTPADAERVRPLLAERMASSNS